MSSLSGDWTHVFRKDIASRRSRCVDLARYNNLVTRWWNRVTSSVGKGLASSLVVNKCAAVGVVEVPFTRPSGVFETNRSLASRHTHPVDVRVEQDVTPWKHSSMISINVTTRIYFVRRLKRLNNQTKFD